MSWVLLVGNATLDIVNTVTHYPQEDEEIRATGQTVLSGGNVANTGLVLLQHRQRVDLAATLADDPAALLIWQALLQAGMDLSCAQTVPDSHSPVSYITLNRENGSRTIVHYRDLPELQLIDLLKINTEKYDWLHLEGRNIAVLADWLPTLQERFDQVISLEIEKPRADIESLIPLVDLVFFSRAYACATGFTQATEFLWHQHKLNPRQILICAWGDQGGYALTPGSAELLFVAAPAVAVVVDTRGAGDVFNAGIIHAISTGQTLAEALAYAVGLASHKVAQSGLHNLV